MKRLFKKSVLAIGLLGATFAAQAQYSCDQIIKNEAYSACYNYDLKSSLFVKYDLKGADLKGEKHSRKGVKFYEEKSIPKKHRSTLADYRSSGYDRSHLRSNASSSYNRKIQKLSFSLVNQSMHTPTTNRTALKSIEKLIRRLTISNGRAKIVTGNVFARINPKRIGPGKVAVPTHAYKVIHFPKTNKTLAFLVKNTKAKKSSKASSYRVDVKELEKLAKVNFDF